MKRKTDKFNRVHYRTGNIEIIVHPFNDGSQTYDVVVYEDVKTRFPITGIRLIGEKQIINVHSYISKLNAFKCARRRTENMLLKRQFYEI